MTISRCPSGRETPRIVCRSLWHVCTRKQARTFTAVLFLNRSKLETNQMFTRGMDKDSTHEIQM